MRKKICFITAARSEYGLLKWLMMDINNSEEFILQLIVTGGHLSQEQGHTVDSIIEDGFNISYTIDCGLDTSSTEEIAQSMGRMCQHFAKAFSELKPDYILVLGDRYELLPICNAAFVMRIPIIHLSGGDVTQGAIDDGIRNAVTMLADYHFPGTVEAQQNIIRMRNTPNNVWAVGEPGLDSFFRENLMTREELAIELGLDINKKWALMTYHAETKKSIEYNLKNVEICINTLKNVKGLQTVITYANADFGGLQINEYIELEAQKFPEEIKVIKSLGNKRYLSFMRQSIFVIGNSSSGIVEAPFLNIPVVNIGDRQRGRYQCGNIIQCSAKSTEVENAISEIISLKEKKQHDDLNYWGDGHTSERIIDILKRVLL